MKKVMLVLVAVAAVSACTASAEAGRFRRAVRRSYYAPVVVRPRYVAPVVVARPVYVPRPVVVARPVVIARPVYVAPPVYVTRPIYSYYGVPTRVHVSNGGYYRSGYYGGGVHVHTQGLGLDISY